MISLGSSLCSVCYLSSSSLAVCDLSQYFLSFRLISSENKWKDFSSACVCLGLMSSSRLLSCTNRIVAVIVIFFCTCICWWCDVCNRRQNLSGFKSTSDRCWCYLCPHNWWNWLVVSLGLSSPGDSVVYDAPISSIHLVCHGVLSFLLSTNGHRGS